jgi:predicted MPP superfamily phosphohydrolase
MQQSEQITGMVVDVDSDLGADLKSPPQRRPPRKRRTAAATAAASASTTAPAPRARPDAQADAKPPAQRRADPELRMAWAVRPCAIEHHESADADKPSLWFQFGGPQQFEWNCVDLPVPGLPAALDGLRIVHLSDFHTVARWCPAYDELLRRLRDDPPDLLLVTGDFVQDRNNPGPALPYIRRLLDGFQARLGCFGVLGNHDRYHMAAHLAGSPVTLLDESRRLIAHGGGTIELIGLPGVDRRDLRWEWLRTIPPRPESAVRIVLSHYPDHLTRTQSTLRPDLFLAGHTHGGQVCLPGGRPIIRHDSLPRRLCKGIHRVGGTWLIVHRGFGYSGLPVRVFCPAEVIEMRLVR